MNYISAIFLDFDNVYSSLFKQSADAAREFATAPAKWLGILKGMQGSESEETSHSFVIRRCYMNPVGRVPGATQSFSSFRQAFVRDGWEVIDTPPLTNQGKTSADTHIVMDVLDAVAHYPHVGEYVLLAADADYTPLVIRLRKHLKTTVVYAAEATAAAYIAACDSVIDESKLIELLLEDPQEQEGTTIAANNPVLKEDATPSRVAEAVRRYFSESEPGHQASVSALGRMLEDKFPGIGADWTGYASLSQLLRKGCGLRVEQVGNRTLAWRE